MKDLQLLSFLALNLCGALATLGVLFMRKASTATLCIAAVIFMMSAIIYILGHHLLTAIILWFFCSWLWMWVSLILFVGHHQREEATTIHRTVEFTLSIIVSCGLVAAVILFPDRTVNPLIPALPDSRSSFDVYGQSSYLFGLVLLLIASSLLGLKLILPYKKFSTNQSSF